MFKKLIVGVDFSEPSERAALVAAGLARALNAEVVLVHVISPVADYADPGRFVAEIRPALEKQLEQWADKLRHSHGIKADWGIVDGRPAEQVVTFAERWGGDLVVTGTSGRTGVSRALLGSVADRVIRTATMPVLVVGPEGAAPART